MRPRVFSRHIRMTYVHQRRIDRRRSFIRHRSTCAQRPRFARPYGFRTMLVSAVKTYAYIDTGAMAPGSTTFLVRLALP